MNSTFLFNTGLKLTRVLPIRGKLLNSHNLSSTADSTMIRLERSSGRVNPSKPSFTSHTKFTPMWWKDVAIVGTVFSITGSCSLALVQPTLNSIGINGSMKEGPWSYRAAHLSLSPPSWCLMLVTIGTCFGKRQYFSAVALKVISRLLPKKGVSLLTSYTLRSRMVLKH